MPLWCPGTLILSQVSQSRIEGNHGSQRCLFVAFIMMTGMESSVTHISPNFHIELVWELVTVKVTAYYSHSFSHCFCESSCPVGTESLHCRSQWFKSVLWHAINNCDKPFLKVHAFHSVFFLSFFTRIMWIICGEKLHFILFSFVFIWGTGPIFHASFQNACRMWPVNKPDHNQGIMGCHSSLQITLQ